MVIIQVTSEFSIFIVHSCYKHIHHTYTHTEKTYLLQLLLLQVVKWVPIFCVYCLTDINVLMLKSTRVFILGKERYMCNEESEKEHCVVCLELELSIWNQYISMSACLSICLSVSIQVASWLQLSNKSNKTNDTLVVMNILCKYFSQWQTLVKGIRAS